MRTPPETSAHPRPSLMVDARGPFGSAGVAKASAACGCVPLDVAPRGPAHTSRALATHDTRGHSGCVLSRTHPPRVIAHGCRRASALQASSVQVAIGIDRERRWHAPNRRHAAIRCECRPRSDAATRRIERARSGTDTGRLLDDISRGRTRPCSDELRAIARPRPARCRFRERCARRPTARGRHDMTQHVVQVMADLRARDRVRNA
jgi:hypothetical protein